MHQKVMQEVKEFDFEMPFANPVHMPLPYLSLGMLSLQNACLAWGLIQLGFVGSFVFGSDVCMANFKAFQMVSKESGISAFPSAMCNFRELVSLLTQVNMATAIPYFTIISGLMGTL